MSCLLARHALRERHRSLGLDALVLYKADKGDGVAHELYPREAVTFWGVGARLRVRVRARARMRCDESGLGV